MNSISLILVFGLVLDKNLVMKLFCILLCVDSNRRYSEGISCLRDGKSLKRITTASKKVKTSSDVLTDKDLSHLVWWKEVKLVLFFG